MCFLCFALKLLLIISVLNTLDIKIALKPPIIVLLYDNCGLPSLFLLLFVNYVCTYMELHVNCVGQSCSKCFSA